MNKASLLLGVVCCLAISTASAQQACCHSNATAAFAEFANDGAFAGQHDEPKPYRHQSKVGQHITYKTADGKKANAYVLKKEPSSDHWLIVIHEWWGLNDYIKKESERLFNDVGNINVMALDLYDGKVATTREKASAFMKEMTTERAHHIIKGALDWMGPSAKVATIGWCFGGGWSMQSSILAGDQGVGCVIYYGMPETDIEQLKKLGGPVLGLFANQENWINPKVVDQFIADMKKAGKELTVKRYDANHAFANPSSERYNSDAAKDAYQETLGFLKKQF